ncbi:MAG: LysR family transcriptional regulator [Lachnospiraceae bacterium]|nr:LysR family transcriptional regulator [Lachnospiraceae bacterium]
MRDIDWQIISTLHEYKNITKAANLLFIAQPTLTKRIQLIEEELGVTIITRSTKGVSFTAEGAFIALKAQQILNTFNDIKLNISQSTNGEIGTLRLGVPNSYARFVLPSLIAKFTEIYKDIKLEIATALSSEVVNLVENREVDVGFVRGNFTTNLEKLEVSDDQIYIVSKSPINLENLPTIPQIEYTKEPTVIKATDIWWKQHFAKPPNIRMKVNHGDTCLAMIKQNLGYGIFSDKNFFKHDPSLFSLPLIYKDGTAFTRKTFLVYHKDDLHNTVLNNFVVFIDKYDFLSPE